VVLLVFLPLFGVCVPILGSKMPNGRPRSQVVLLVFEPLFGVCVLVLGPKMPNGRLR